MPISLTVPEVPPASTKSPIRYGLKIIITTPAAKWLKLPCSAIPIANAAAPKIATKLVVTIPKVLATLKINRTFKNIDTKERKYLDRKRKRLNTMHILTTSTHSLELQHNKQLDIISKSESPLRLQNGLNFPAAPFQSQMQPLLKTLQNRW